MFCKRHLELFYNCVVEYIDCIFLFSTIQDIHRPFLEGLESLAQQQLWQIQDTLLPQGGSMGWRSCSIWWAPVAFLSTPGEVETIVSVGWNVSQHLPALLMVHKGFSWTVAPIMAPCLAQWTSTNSCFPFTFVCVWGNRIARQTAYHGRTTQIWRHILCMRPCTLFTKTPHSQAKVELTEEVTELTEEARLLQVTVLGTTSCCGKQLHIPYEPLCVQVLHQSHDAPAAGHGPTGRWSTWLPGPMRGPWYRQMLLAISTRVIPVLMPKSLCKDMSHFLIPTSHGSLGPWISQQPVPLAGEHGCPSSVKSPGQDALFPSGSCLQPLGLSDSFFSMFFNSTQHHYWSGIPVHCQTWERAHGFPPSARPPPFLLPPPS